MKKFILWTDGSALENGVPTSPAGYAYHLQELQNGKIVKEKTSGGGVLGSTNNRMEMTAVIEGLKSIRAKKTSTVTVKSDSNLVIKGITEWRSSWEERDFRGVKNEDLWRELYQEVDKFKNISFEHVKAHSGIRENEIVDKYSRKEAKNVKK